MELSRPPLVVAFELSERRKAIVADALAGASVVIYLTELDGTARAEALRNAGALLTHNTAKDLRSGEAAHCTARGSSNSPSLAWISFRWANSPRVCPWQPTAAVMPSR